MTPKRIDCRGLACPAPVLKTKEALDQGGTDPITVLVDNEAAKENVRRFLSRNGYQVTVQADGETIVVEGSRDGAQACEIFVPEPNEAEDARVLVLVGTQRMGSGDDTLGEKLMENFLGTLQEMGPALWRLVFLNAGVTFTVDDSPVLNVLQDLEKAGVHILVCGTCLSHFGLLERKKVGETTNMLDIVTSLQLADRVISFT
ncbi:selenium metabolism protein YedF [Desulfacinum hydrothermale DSM 13146]|uniref:Selenium metabolism protein YedF n=1 Tax=Desulfacinum hydrothermale DSM 13146 TaxID=1121390 RepID=A0A1W1XI93_9BACT|nr:sulfurtransferase-like selenium metabolism protein YedF [Desulfacinum hydrothermale]SMC23716.1 selenium metabolism protein YedF [Desulfacinum hydrothermale DSM 13146]